jgi:hypothetical protein
MLEHPIDSLVDYLTVEDILIELLDDSSFKAKVIQHPGQLYGDDNFGDVISNVSTIPEVCGLFDRRFRTQIPIEKKQIKFCELDKNSIAINDQLFDEPIITQYSRIITRKFEVTKTSMLLLIRVYGDNSKFFYENELFMDTYNRLKSYLNKDMFFSKHESLPSSNSALIVIGFNSYKAEELK